MVEASDSEGVRFPAVPHSELERFEDHLVESGYATVAQVKRTWEIIDAVRSLQNNADLSSPSQIVGETLASRCNILIDRSGGSDTHKGRVADFSDTSAASVGNGDAAVGNSAGDLNKSLREAFEVSLGKPSATTRESRRRFVRLDAVAAACEGFNANQRLRKHRLKKLEPSLEAMLPLEPPDFWSRVARSRISSSFFRGTVQSGMPEMLASYRAFMSAVVKLKTDCGFRVGGPSNLAFPQVETIEEASLSALEPVEAASIEEIQREWDAMQTHKQPNTSEPSVTDKAEWAASAPGPGCASPGVQAPVSLSIDSRPTKAPTSIDLADIYLEKEASSAPTGASDEPTSLSDENRRAFSNMVSEAQERSRKHFELEMTRLAYAHAQKHGGAAFLAIDVEMWDRNTDHLLEFGWSLLQFVKGDKSDSFQPKRTEQHIVVRENSQMRNGRHSPDNRDNFAFGKTVQMPQKAIYHTLAALLSTLSANQHVFVMFHDPRADLRALEQLDFDMEREFRTDLRQLGATSDSLGQESSGKWWIVDTQRLFSAWIDRPVQVGLEKACKEVKLSTRPELLHNAANDACFTLSLFMRLMRRKPVSSGTSPLIVEIDARIKSEMLRKEKLASGKAVSAPQAQS